MSTDIQPIVMPKWGLAMTEGLLTSWLVEEGRTVASGDEIAEIETSKIVNTFESPVQGLLRRRVAAEGETLPVGALLGVVADASVSEDALAQYISDFQAAFVPPEADDEALSEPELVQVDGRPISYLRMGPEEGETVLLLHGFGADLNGWLFTQPALAEHFQVYAMDLPGHGGSSKDIGDGDIDTYAAVVSTFIDALSLAQVHLVGHSLGGAIATRVAATATGTVASLTLIAPAGLGSDINTSFLDSFVAAKRRKDLKPVLEQLVADPGLISRDMMDGVLKFKRLDGVEAALRGIIAANFVDGRQASDLRPLLASVSVPTAVVWGREDRIIPPAHSDGLPDSVQVTVIDGAGHVPQMERANEVNDIIKTHIEAR